MGKAEGSPQLVLELGTLGLGGRRQKCEVHTIPLEMVRLSAEATLMDQLIKDAHNLLKLRWSHVEDFGLKLLFSEDD